MHFMGMGLLRYFSWYKIFQSLEFVMKMLHVVVFLFALIGGFMPSVRVSTRKMR